MHTEPFGVARHTFDADFRVIPHGCTSAGIGFTRIAEDRSHIASSSRPPTTCSASRSTRSSQQWFSVRTKYEHAQRRGDGIEEGELLLAAIGEQPGMRHFDIAEPRSRSRDRAWIGHAGREILTATLSFAAGKDDYLDSDLRAS